MVSKKKSTMWFIVFLMLISISSGIITYRIVVERSSQKPVIKEGEKEKICNNEQWNFDINNIFKEIESIYIRNSIKPSGTVELKGRDKGIIVANFKALQKEQVNKLEIEKQMLNLDLYKYEIDIIEKNIKMKFCDKIEYMVIEKTENMEEEKRIYRLRKEESKSFLSILENMYIDKVIEKIVYPIPDRIYLSTSDNNALYVMNGKEIKDLISNFKILSIEDSEEYIGITEAHPYYNITIKRDDYEFKFCLMNRNLIIIDTPIAYLYCKYDGKIWDNISEKLPLQNSY